MNRSAYKYDVQASFVLNNESTDINSNLIKYIVIESNYELIYMPVIYISIAANTDLFNKIINNEKSAKFYLRIDRYNEYSQNKLYKKYISGLFTYITSTSNANYTEDLSSSNDPDNTYTVINLALMNMEILNTEKQSFNGIYKDIDQGTLILKAFEGINNVICPPKYNPHYDTVMIPPLSSIHKYISHLYDLCPFYDTNYMFFIDFDRAYLLDYSGNYCPCSDGQKETVIIEINSVLNEKAYYEGVEERENEYYLYINPAYNNVYKNRQTDKIMNQLVFIGDDGNVQKVDVNVNTSDDSAIRQLFVRKNDEFAKLYMNIMNNNAIDVEVMKENIDPSIITPNKQFIVKNSKDSSVDGKYILKFKKEVIRNISGIFNCSVDIGLRKVVEAIPIRKDIEVKAVYSNSIYRRKPVSTTTSKQSDTNILTNSGKIITKNG